MKWPTESIGTVAHVNPKLAPADRPVPDQTVSFVPMAAVSEQTLCIEAEVERPFAEVAKGYTSFKRGDLLIAKITPCFENGKMALADNLTHELGFGTTEFHVLRPTETVFGAYLFHLLRAPYVRKAGEMKMKGAAGQRRVPVDFFTSLQIPLPPLAEQKRIAGILDAADALRANRRETLAQLDTLLQSTFLDMFGDPVTNPMGWEKPTLAGLCNRVIDCPHSTPQWSDAGVICLRTSNLGKGEWIWADTRFVTEEEYEERTKRGEIKENDIILSREGTVGVLALVESGMRLCMGQRLVQLRPMNSRVNPKFLMHILLHDLAPERLSQLMAGSTSKHLNVKELRNLRVMLPPLSLQRRFASIVESVERQKARMRAHLAELDALFASLQSRAFNGEL
jgi:type I restriction enzyme S subunit